jgi:CBS domain-containing protein
MKIGEIMNRAPISVRMDQTFGEAYRALVETGHTFLPVVDASGVYHGNFDLQDVWGVLLPKAARLERKSIENLAFVSSSIEKMKEQLAEVAETPVSKYVTRTDAPPLSPDNPLIQGILMLDECGQTLAVVDPHSKKLVGVLSAADVLGVLR